VIALAGCGDSPVKKPRDSSVEPDGASGGTGGFVTGGSSGSGGTGGTSGTGGIGGTGGSVVVEPPAQDSGPDATPDAQSDAGDASTDAMADGGDAAPTCMPACTVGSKRCGTGGLETCALVNGCAAWGTAVACGANRTCTTTAAGGDCTCNAPPGVCTAAGNFCSSGTERSTCEMVNGCLALSATKKTCGARQTCTGNLPGGDCVCNAAPAGCAAAGTFCPTATSVGTCAQDTDGCFFKSGNDTTCMNGQVCVMTGATAACACPATVGTTLGTACTTVGQTVCAGDTVLTCTMNATSGCKAWTLTTDCAANNAGLSCGTKAGPAACECPAATGGNYYVDPVAGSDSTGSAPFPSGAKSPAACRLKTLSKAAVTAVNSGNKIIAITQTLPGVFTESAPLNIQGGVTLTTDDATPNPINYRINYTGSSGAAVVLGSGSAVSGFTIGNGNTAANLSNPSVGISCTAGTVTVSRMALEGTNASGNNMMATGLQIGIMPINTCTGTFSNISVDGFATNVFVSTSAGVAPVLTSVQAFNTLAGNVGMLVEAGTVTTTDLVINSHTPGTFVGYGVIVRPGSPITVANYLGTSTSVQNTSNDAIWLDTVGGMLAPQATLTSPVITSPTGAGVASGIVVEGGTLNITGTGQITSPDHYGLEVSGTTTVVIATGLQISGSSDDGVHVTGGSVTLHNTKIMNSLNRNLFMDNGAVLLDDGSTATGAANAGIHFAGGANDSLIVGSTTGGLVDIGNNGGHGISLTGTGSATTTVTVRRSNIHDNSLNGVNVALSANANAVTIEDSGVYANHLNGVVVTGAPSATATNSVILDNLDVRLHTGNVANAGKGIWLNGNDATSSNITATITACKVHDNRDVGIQIDEDMPAGTVTTTRATLTSNDIYANNSTSVNTVAGGILFPTSSTLTLFTGNKIHSNGKDQIVFASPPTTGTVWDLDSGSCTSTATPPNQIYCYGTNNYGVRTTNTLPGNPPDFTVDADHNFWAHSPASNTAGNRDYTAGADTTITVANSCTPAVTTCP
jgi:hypothetical protein